MTEMPYKLSVLILLWLLWRLFYTWRWRKALSLRKEQDKLLCFLSMS